MPSDENAANKSMDVRAKQRLSFNGVFYPKLACWRFPAVISIVRQLHLKSTLL
ncbi:MAG TPA: hypothetical protein VK308_03840 [Pyrinomonadaceae bacterium]|nr:hypothetical protein [Pyrinomonadaceae bacterium]